MDSKVDEELYRNIRLGIVEIECIMDIVIFFLFFLIYWLFRGGVIVVYGK